MGLQGSSLAELHKLLGVPATCDDKDLRRAYRREILANHPDHNPDDPERATKHSQDINIAYDTIVRYRANPSPISKNSFSDLWEGFKFTVTIEFGSFVDIREIAHGKYAFRQALEEFRKSPQEVLLALKLIHASFMAERHQEVNELLVHQLLIDSSGLLLQIVDIDQAVQTILRWADHLVGTGKAKQATQIVEDAYEDLSNNDCFRDRLRTYHYLGAQGYYLEKGQKPSASERIEHLKRIIELGFELDYVHKLLAEAYFENGDRDNALAHLMKAKQLNPDFSGGVKISRALGLLPPQEKRKRTGSRQEYAFTDLEQIPHPSQIRAWAHEKQWAQILPLADIGSFSPKIIPRSRSTIGQVAESLGDCPDNKALGLLRALKKSIYWDVRKAAESSLARWGKRNAHQIVPKSEKRDNDPAIVRKLWDMLVFEEYHPANDPHYVTALTNLGHRILHHGTPDAILGALREMTRWLELIGEREMTVWIRELIRCEAPGTCYVDPPHRDNYIRKVGASKELMTKLGPLFEEIKLQAPAKLAQALGSQDMVGEGTQRKD